MRAKFLRTGVSILVLSLLPILSVAGELDSDEHTLLLLHFNNSLSGDGGESPVSAFGVSYTGGVQAQAAFFADPNAVIYGTADNLDGAHGTLEFWIQPQWEGNDSQDHWVLQAGGAGGMLVGKDGGNFWRIILNRYGAGGNPEIGTGVWVADDWSVGEWHHAAFSWSPSAVRVYIDGELRDSTTGSFSLPAISDVSFHLGSDNGGGPADGLLDELRISAVARSDEEILASYLAGPTLSALAIEPSTADLLETWWVLPEVSAATNLGPLTLPSAALTWSSTDESVASASSAGWLVAHASGTATLTGSFGGEEDTVAVTVTEPVLPPTDRLIDPFLSTPARGSLWEIPVVILRYLPTTDGVHVDPDITGVESTLADLEDRIDELTIETKFMLEEGSRWRGYQSSDTRSSLGYRVVKIVNVYESFQKGGEVPWNPGIYFPDYNQILTRANAGEWVDSRGVKEFWIWGWHHSDIEQPESNMSSPLTGDISNSVRWNDDLPVYNSTYTVYGYNFSRTSNESVHNHGHQLEALLSHANQIQDGDTDLFWHQFVGQDSQDEWITGRCGWTHMPPNTTDHYDYWNPTLVESDCQAWTPAGTGDIQLVNADTWGNLVYPWPDGPPADDLTQHQFYMWWMQNMPGRGNAIPYDSEVMTNWWVFTGDWDGAISRGVGLHGADDCDGSPEVVLTNRDFDSAEVVEACRILQAGDQVRIRSADEVRFRAGETIIFGDGFSVEQGAKFTAEIAPVLFPF
jgi:hypothetical protein